uniref:PX domain-containing protein n=1 Tax=Sander lucioperca TaxID=283035 RepID=A0A8D0DDI8_SANLU
HININHEGTRAPCCSTLTTQQLQQNLRAEKKRERPVRLLFEIPTTRIIEHVLSKYVVYDIVVMRSGSFDSRRVSVERRYSDFSRLHHDLLEEFVRPMYRGLVLAAAAAGLIPTCDPLLHVIPPLSPLSNLIYVYIYISCPVK